MGFFRQEYWSGFPCPPPEDLPNPGIKPTCLASPALAGGFFTTVATWEAPELGFFALTLHALSAFSLVLGFGIFVCVCVCWDSSRGLSRLIDHEGSSLQA